MREPPPVKAPRPENVLSPGELMRTLSPSSPLTGLRCGGALRELVDAGQLAYRCRTGHRLSAKGLPKGQTDAVENALYVALRSVQERQAGLHRLAEQTSERFPGLQHDDKIRAGELERAADVLCTLLRRG